MTLGEGNKYEDADEVRNQDDSRRKEVICSQDMSCGTVPLQILNQRKSCHQSYESPGVTSWQTCGYHGTEHHDSTWRSITLL
jgi:hypothetical protein